MTRRKTAEVPSYAGRAAFLDAAQRVWKPALLATLSEAILPVGDWLRSRFPDWFAGWFTYAEPRARKHMDQFDHVRWQFQVWPFGWSELSSDSSREGVAAYEALERWRSLYPISPADCWIMDYSLRSIAYHVRFGDPLRWYFCPGERMNPGFTPQLPMYQWHPDPADRKRRQQELINDLRRQLRAYDANIRAGLRATASNLGQHAVLAARWFAGESIQQISASSPSDESTISRDLHRFAMSIGLTTPPIRNTVGTFVGTRKQKLGKTRTL